MHMGNRTRISTRRRANQTHAQTIPSSSGTIKPDGVVGFVAFVSCH